MPAKITLRKTSLVDYPGRVSAVIFFYGCNLRCPWCHNPELVSGGENGLLDAAEDFLYTEDGLAHAKKRRAVLGGVVLSGGEPCLWKELPDYIREIKKLELPVKLDTNGMFPAMLEKLLSKKETAPDYIALDLKLAPERYTELLSEVRHAESGRAGTRGAFSPGEALRHSAALIRESNIAHEYRTLALPGTRNVERVLETNLTRRAPHKSIIGENDIEALAPLVDSSPWYFRVFRGGNCLDPAWNDLEEGAEEARARAASLAEKARALGKNGEVR